MATVSTMIPQTVVGGITKMMIERDDYVVTRLSDAYGFDKEEALRMIGVPNVDISDDESVSSKSTTSSGKRGRPRMTAEEKAAKAAEKAAAKAAAKAEREAAKAEKQRLKDEAKAERIAKREAVKAEKEAAKAERIAKREAAKAAKEAAKAEKAAAKAAKAASKKLEMPAFNLPFVHHVFEDRCFGIRVNGNLFNQCMKAKKHGSDYCTTCGKTGAPKAGDIRSRMEIPDLEFVGTNGKKVIRYSKFMAKKELTREQVEEEAAKFDIVIPEEQFEEVTSKRGRPKSNGSSKTSSGASTPKRSSKKGAAPKGDLLEALAAHVDTPKSAAVAEDSEMEEEAFVDNIAETEVDGVWYTVKKDTGDVFNKETGEYAGKYDSESGDIEFLDCEGEEDDLEFEEED